MFKLETIKYIGICDERILTHKGFKKISKIENSTIRLFNNPCDLQKYLDEKPFSNKYRFDVVPKKIKVTYEELWKFIINKKSMNIILKTL